ncbi:DNA mismatch repair protein MSH3, partial [Mucuna pruriens]
MGKQKQQVISRFFAPEPKSPPSTTTRPNPPSPKIAATVTFSPSKRRLTSNITPPRKLPKLLEPSPPSRHQRFLQKLLEPSSPQQPSSSSKPPNYTPLEQQVLDLKAKYPDVLLMVEVGYKYRFFGQDAEHAARVLGIYAHMDHNFLTASVPTFRLNVHVRRLVSAGYKVGVVKQTETAAIKAHGSNRVGPFDRGLSALYTKATLEAAPDLGGGEDGCGGESNYLLCVVDKSVLGEKGISGFDVRVGVVAVEISTGDVVYGEFSDNFLRSALEALVLSFSPAELLLGDPLSKQTVKLLLDFAGPASNVRVERVSRDCFTDGGALAEVMTLYENMCVNSPSDSMQNNDMTENRSQQLVIKEVMNMSDLAVQALALTIRHLKEFGFERILCSGASLRPFSSNTEITLSANTLQQLE